MGPKSENVGFSLVLPQLFEGSKKRKVIQDCEKPSGPDRRGGGRRRVNPPPRSLFWRFWRFGGLVVGSGHLHA